MPKSKTQVKKGLDRLMNAPGTSDDIWDDLLGASDPRKRFVRSLGGARKYDDRAAVLVFQAMVEAHLARSTRRRTAWRGNAMADGGRSTRRRTFPR